MSSDPVGSPLASRSREQGLQPTRDGESKSPTYAVGAAGDKHPLRRELLTLEAWVQALDAVEVAAVALSVVRRVHPEYADTVRSEVASQAALTTTQKPVDRAPDRADRDERFESFARVSEARIDGKAPIHNASSSSGSSGNSSAGPSGHQSFRSFRPLGQQQPAPTAASPFVNSFISPVPKAGLYSQAFAPLGQQQQQSQQQQQQSQPSQPPQQQQFTPWSLSQELNRPKSSGDSSYATSYQHSHPWGKQSSQSYSASNLDLMRSNESKLQPVSKPWTAQLSSTNGIDVAPSPPSPAVGTIGTMSAAPGGPSKAPNGQPTTTPAVLGVPGAGQSTPQTSSSQEKVWNGKPFSPVLSATVQPATLSASTSPVAKAASPYTKRTVNFMDPELLSDMGAWLRSLRLHKYTENLSDMPWQEVVRLNDEELEARGVNALGARRKMLKMFEEIRAAYEAGELQSDSV